MIPTASTSRLLRNRSDQPLAPLADPEQALKEARKRAREEKKKQVSFINTSLLPSTVEISRSVDSLYADIPSPISQPVGLPDPTVSADLPESSTAQPADPPQVQHQTPPAPPTLLPPLPDSPLTPLSSIAPSSLSSPPSESHRHIERGNLRPPPPILSAPTFEAATQQLTAAIQLSKPKPQVNTSSTMATQQDLERVEGRMTRIEQMLEQLLASSSANTVPSNRQQLPPQASTSKARQVDGPGITRPATDTDQSGSQNWDRLESILLNLAQNQTRQLALTVPSPGQQTTTGVSFVVNASSIRSNKVPILDGSKRDVFAVLGWLGRLEQLFNGKNLTDNKEKIKVAGMGISDSRWGEWFRSELIRLQELSWEVFCEKLKAKFLPANWEFEILRDLSNLKMGDRESFEQFSERALKLHAVVKAKVSEFQLATNMLSGMPRALALDIQDTDIHLKVPFSLDDFVDVGKRKHARLLEMKKEVGPSGSQNSRSAGQTGSTSGGNTQFTEAERKAYGVWRFKCWFAENGYC